MKLSSWIAFRYLFSKSAGRFAPLLTATAISAIAVGMLALVLIMSVMRGFRTELTDRLIGFGSHITLTRGAGAKALDEASLNQLLPKDKITDASPFVQGEVIAQSEAAGELSAQGARVRGIKPSSIGRMSRVELYFPEGGEGAQGILRRSGSLAGAVIGSDVVSQLSVHPDFADSIELVAPLAEVLSSGELGPNSRRFSVAGVFRTGVFEYDGKYILVGLDEAKELLGVQAKEGWFIKLKDPGTVGAVLEELRPSLPNGWSAAGWHEQNRKLFEALKLERLAMGGVLAMVLLIASFAVVGVVLLVTAAKRKDIAIMESAGMETDSIMRIFLMHAAFIGAIGSAAGLVAGLALCFALERWPIALPDSYYIDYLPVEVGPASAAAFALAGVAIAVVAAFFPVRQAVKQKPAEVLRYE
ncbi:MAG TPA: ABC transporter permease [bacterium]|nr:ABC transporter permease [bacterium]